MLHLDRGPQEGTGYVSEPGEGKNKKEKKHVKLKLSYFCKTLR